MRTEPNLHVRFCGQSLDPSPVKTGEEEHAEEINPMHPAFASFAECFNEVYADLNKTLDGLPQEAVDWVPGPEMNSMGVLVAHTAGATRFWVGTVALNDPAPRDRDAEFKTAGKSAAELQKMLAGTLAYTTGALEKFTPADLEKQVTSPRHPDRTFSVAYCLLHGLSHSAEHLGHLQMIRQLWEQR
jgi:hypothetical protein